MSLSWRQYPKVASCISSYKKIVCALRSRTLPRECIAYGNGRSYGDSALSATIIPMKERNKFLNFDEDTGILHVQSGVLLSETLSVFVPRGWFLPVTPGTKEITIGGAIASDVHGKNHHIDGCFSAHVLECHVVVADGSIVLCSLSDTPELFRATCGGMGLTGIILDAKIRLKKITSHYIAQTTVRTDNLEETFDAFEHYKTSKYTVAWIDCLASGAQLGRSVLTVGDVSPTGGLDYRPKRALSVPCSMPSFLLNSWSVRAFNYVYYHTKKESVSEQLVDFDSFFYPLDGIKNWNRIYGRSGFVQYQCILPKDNSFVGISALLKRISDVGKGSFLAVLKLYGPANDNYLSFPMEGYSLALDFKIEKGTFELLDELDTIVTAYQGRIYLAKDARIKRDVFEQGYPSVDRFRRFRADHNLDTVFQSYQSKRLGI